MKNSRRIETPDILKGLAVIFMIQVHLMELFAKQGIYDSLTGKVSLFLGGVPAAPVFMVMMGYFVAYSEKKPVFLIKRGVKLFVAGLILNIGLNLHLIYNILFKDWQINIWHYIFGVDIFHLAGLSLIIIGLLLIVFNKKPVIYLLLTISIPLISSFIEKGNPGTGVISYFKAYLTGGQAWSYFPLIPWLAYPLAGFTVRLFEKKYFENRISYNIKMAIAVASGILFIFTAGFGFTVSSDLEKYYTHGIVFFLWALLFIILLASIISLMNIKAGDTVAFRYFKWLGKNVTTIYVFQWLIIGNIATSVYKTQSLQEFIVWFIVITLIVSYLTILWNKLKTSFKLDFFKL